mgnify:CR=1 FL=1
MAIVRTAGTEIIRSHVFEDVGVDTALIVGVQHHIYTVLSIVIYASALNSTSSNAQIYIVGYDSFAGTSAQNIELFYAKPQVGETFVWADKFSFNGCEPTDFSGAMDSAADQDLIADQAVATSQVLRLAPSNAGDDYNVIVTFIDQNNS